MVLLALNLTRWLTLLLLSAILLKEQRIKKFVDDLTMMEVVNLKENLVQKLPTIGPLNFHERHGLDLPRERSILQHKLDDLLQFTNKNKMMINAKKTNIMPFNFTKSLDFIPNLSFPGGDQLNVIYQTKLVGVVVNSPSAGVPIVSTRSQMLQENFGC